MKPQLAFLIFLAFGSRAQTHHMTVCQDCPNNQHWFYFNPLPDSSDYYLWIDTSQSNNAWQIGHVQKSVFTSGNSGPNALITDTVNPYPVNNVSSFEFSLINCAFDNAMGCGGNYWGPGITIYNRIESDSLVDGGTIEVSHDNGLSWVNVINDSVNYPSVTGTHLYTNNDTVLSLGKPGFSGSIGWNEVSVMYQPSFISGTYDTITFRLTFASDSIQTNRDGWMIGSVEVSGIFEGIDEIRNDNLISISPNPVSEELIVHCNAVGGKPKFQVLNIEGDEMIEHDFENIIDTRQLSNGIYFLKYSDGKNFTVKKFIVQH